MLLQQLETFVRAVQEGSFSRAGELLGLTQPAVSRQIGALERELGTVLIDRSGRAFHLTAAGQVVYDHAHQIMGLVERMRSHLRTVSRPQSGEVSVACVTTVGLYTLPTLIAELSQHYPDMRVRVWSGRIDGVLDRVLDGTADVGFVSAPVVNPRLRAVPLFDDPVIPVASPSYVERLPDPVPLDVFADLDMILFESPSRFRTLLDATLQQAGITPNVAMEFDSHEAVRAAVLLGRGVALVPLQAVSRDLASGALVRLHVDGFPEIVRTTSLVLRKSTILISPAVDVFVRLVIARYASGIWHRDAEDEPRASG